MFFIAKLSIVVICCIQLTFLANADQSQCQLSSTCSCRNGRDGRDGKNGHNGIDGTNGLDGRDGQNCQQETVKNWKECAFRKASGLDIGKIYSCMFTKKMKTTLLQVVVSTNMRIRDCDNCCKRWYLTFDGKECNAPLPIDGTIYVWQGKGRDDDARPRVIRGHCNIPKTGAINVELHVGNCDKSYATGDALTGWHSTSRIYIEEVNPPQA